MPYSMAAFQKGTRLTVYFESEGEVLLLYIKEFGTELRNKIINSRKKNCDSLAIEEFPVMMMDTSLKSFACNLIDVYLNYHGNRDFKKSKFPELESILSRTLPLNEVSKVLYPILENDKDIDFKNTVIENYRPNDNVKTLAYSCGYRTRLFTNTFRSVFGENPGTWIKAQQKKLLLSRLKEGKMSYKMIAGELGMSSQQQLTRFCKRELGTTPSAISKHKIIKY